MRKLRKIKKKLKENFKRKIKITMHDKFNNYQLMLVH